MASRTFLTGLAVVIALTGTVAPAAAQKAGQSIKVSFGTVAGMEPTTLQSEAAKGAIVGGVLGYHVTKSRRSKSSKRWNAALGAAVGAGAKRSSEGDLSAILYTVDLGSSKIKVVTEQTEIRLGDCVAVEETKKGANVRRMDPAACGPIADDVQAEMMEEYVEEAEECLLAKDQLLAAETDEAMEMAATKVRILCGD